MQAPARHCCPAPHCNPTHAVSTWQVPATHTLPAPHEGEQAASQNPSTLQLCPAAQSTKAHDRTQSPIRQKVPVGQLEPAHGSSTQVPVEQIFPAAHPVSAQPPAMHWPPEHDAPFPQVTPAHGSTHCPERHSWPAAHATGHVSALQVDDPPVPGPVQV